MPLLDPNLIPVYLMVLTAIFSSVAFIFKWKTGFIKPVIEEKEEEKEEVHERRKASKLAYNSLFSELDEMESYFKTRYQQSNPIRTKLAVELIVQQIRLWRPILINLANDIDKCPHECGGVAKRDCNRISNLVCQAQIAGSEAYLNWCDNLHVTSVNGDRLYTEEDKATMKVYIAKYAQFNLPAEEMVRIILEDICSSLAYETCHDKGRDVLHAYKMYFVFVKLTAEKTLAKLNGDISELRFFDERVGE